MIHFLFSLCTVFSLILFSFCRNDSTNTTINIQNRPFNAGNASKLSELNYLTTVENRFNCPENYTRIRFPKSSFKNWLRTFPLKEKGTPVYLYNKELKSPQSIHAAILDIDAGTTDLQQCADAVMRLRAEYLFQKKAFDSIVFTFTNGTKAPYSKWREGYRVHIKGNTVTWTKDVSVDTTYKTFRQYLNTIFMYCGTYSLSKELNPVHIKDLQCGDVFIHGGFPGHAVIVMDLAINKNSGKKIFLLAQSYMPAQDIHIVKNLTNDGLSPWYEIPEDGTLRTAEWTFKTDELKRF